MSPRTITNVTYDFRGKVVLITGGGRGQGRAHALGFAGAGADVAICDIGQSEVDTVPYGLATSEDINSVAEEVTALGARCLPAVCDVRDSHQVSALVEDVVEEFGGIDIVVNNAGVESLYTVQEMPEEAWDVLLDTNLKGAFLVSKHAIPHMIGRGGGRIIITGSVNSVGGTPKQAHYTAAKHGLVGLAKAMAIDLAEHEITVNLVCPGGVDTPMVTGLQASRDGEWTQTLDRLTGTWNLISPEDMLEPEEITRAIMWLASDAAQFVTGLSLLVDAGFSIK